jgi:cell division protein FtsI/penicillin-binding protein 2
MNTSKGFVKGLVISLVTLAIGFYLVTKVTFGFVPLFILLIIFLCFPLLESPEKNDRANKLSGLRSFAYTLLLLLFGLLCVFALGNYVNPEKEVFKNTDHHALRADGVSISNFRGYRLAGNSPYAFFDSELHRGSITVNDVAEGTVRLSFDGFTSPVYTISGKEMRKFKLVNPDAFASFKDGDSVEFVKRVNGHEQVIGMVILPGHERAPRWAFWKRDLDSARYVFNGQSASLENRFLKSGLPLSSLIAGVVPEFDPKGIQIFRDTIDYNLKNREIYPYYRDRRYFIGYNAEAEISEIRVNGRRTSNTGRYTADIRLGEPFCIGFGSEKTETMCFGMNEGRLTLEFYQPKYQYLPCYNEKDDQSLMVTTSLFENRDNQLLGAYSENIALFSQFDKTDNRNQMQPWFLSYRAGRSDTPLSFDVYSDRHYSNLVPMDRFIKDAGGSWSKENRHSADSSIRYQAYLPGINAADPSIQWLVGVENFKETTPFSARKIALLIFAAILAAALILGLNFVFKHPVLTGTEYAAYLIVIAFLTVRCFLLWRVTVFPPVSSISYFEFNHLRDMDLFKWLVRSVFAFFALVGCYKIYILVSGDRVRKAMTRRKSETRRYIPQKWVILCAIMLVYAGLFLVGGSGGTLARITNILIPVLVFFFFEHLIFKFYAKDYLEDTWDLERNDNPIGDRLWPVLLSLANIALASMLTFIKDGGYGVMFLLFGLIISVFLISDLCIYTLNGNRTHNIKRPGRKLSWLPRVLLYLFVVAFGLLYMDLFIWVLDHRIVFAVSMFLTLCIVFILLSFVLGFNDDLKVSGWAAAIGSIALLSIGVYFVAGELVDGSHLEYRTRVHMNSPSEILATHIDDNVSQNKFMQASLNDWILQEYSDIGKEVKPLREKYGYFKLQPQSKLGAMWFAQTTDIALSRFIIAEHSHLLAYLLVLALFFFLIVATKRVFKYRSGRFIHLAIPLLLFLQAGLILFANTRQFIFFGQDFPLISVTSKLSSIYFFMLLGIFLVSTLREKSVLEGGEGSVINSEARRSIYEHDRKTNIKVIACAFTIILLPVLTTWMAKKKSHTDNASYVSDGMYSLDPLMSSVQSITEALDTLAFEKYQEHHPMRLKRDMSAEMTAFRNDTLYRQFMAQADLDTNKFATRIIDRFIDIGSHNNTAKGLVHLRTRRSYSSDGTPKDILEFAINDDFYEYQLPKKQKNAWKGSIVGDRLSPYDSSGRGQSGDIVALRLKKEWIKEDSDMLLVQTNSGTIRILGENSVVDITPQGLPVAAVSGKDNLMRGRNAIPLGMLPRENYFARNVMINGNRTFLYPYGDTMFWLREFANQTKLAKESILRPGNKLASADEIKRFNENVSISISEALSSRIYDSYLKSNSKRDKTVVVADGNGHIKAMVDYRGGKEFRLNPNDERTISRISERIYLEGLRRSPLEQRYFATFATSPLRLGPGSSQKPIVWTSVTSGYNIGFWNSLRIKPLSEKFVRVEGNRSYFYFPEFAGQRIQKEFKSIASDESRPGGVDLDVEWYMYKSSNYYNAMMTYFGLFTKEQLRSLLPERIDADNLLVRRLPLDLSRAKQDAKYFPIMGSDRPSNSGYDLFVFSRRVSVSDYQNQQGLLARGLETEFNLPLKRERHSLYPSIKRYVKNDDGKYEIRSGFGDVSFFNMGIRQKMTRPEEMMEVGVRTVAIGNNTGWIVSPLKMAEMYGRLLTLNSNYTLTLDSSSQREYQPFSLDDSWQSSGSYQSMRAPFIRGLSKVFFDTNGTARGVSLPEVVTSDNITGTGNTSQYYIYGKTGTINGKWNGEKEEDHLLAVIITNRKITSCDDLSNVKFYVLYFTDYDYSKSGGKRWQSIDGDIIKLVIESEDFREYMDSN